MSIPERIVEAIRNDNLVLFAGAGFSRYLGLPDWKKMAEDLAHSSLDPGESEEIRRKLSTGEFTPSQVIEQITTQQPRSNRIIRDYIARNFRIPLEQPVRLHAKACGLSRKIVTTNYDNAFENAIIQQNSGRLNVIVKHDDRYNAAGLGQAKEFVFKLHGCANSPESCLVTAVDYRKLYADPENPSIRNLQSLSIHSTIVFIGFSFSDPEITYIFEEQNSIFRDYLTHYILTTTPEKFGDKSFLSPIHMEDFTGIESFLDRCLKIKKSGPVATVDIGRNEEEWPEVASVVEAAKGTDLFKRVEAKGPKGIEGIVAESFPLKRLAAGEALCHRKDSIDSFWLIVEGEIVVKKENEIISKRRSGDIIGEAGLIQNRRSRSSDLIASKETRVLEIKQETIKKASQRNQIQVWKNLANILCAKLNSVLQEKCKLVEKHEKEIQRHAKKITDLADKNRRLERNNEELEREVEELTEEKNRILREIS